MTDLDPAEHPAEHTAQRAVRQAVLDLAGEGRPVNLGEAALRGVRRRRVRVVAASAVAVAAVIATVALWPGWTHRTAVPPADAVPTTSETWPAFHGLGRVPAPPGPSVTDDRLVIWAYLAPNRGLHLLDPLTGSYPPAPGESVLAVSPDLRYALITRTHDGALRGTGRDVEVGIYDAVGQEVVGRINLEAHLDNASYTGWTAAWSPDGATIMIPVQEAQPSGGGWLVRHLLFVDASTGQVDTVEVKPAGGLEPQALVGWSADFTRLIFEADPVGTDLVPTGHLLVDPLTGAASAVTWPTQGHLVLGVANSEVAVLAPNGTPILALDQVTGEVLPALPALPGLEGEVTPRVLRGGELVAVNLHCETPESCRPPTVLAVDRPDGTSRVLRTLEASAQYLWLAPINGVGGPVALLAF